MGLRGDLRTQPIHSGHHEAEEAPDEVARALIGFLAPRFSAESGTEPTALLS